MTMPISRTSRSFSIVIALAAAALVALAPAPARAEKRNAKVYFDKGASEYNLGHFEAAIAAFEKAYDISPAPILLFNIGQCHRQSGNKDRAVFFYRRYLEQAPDAANRAEVEGRIADLEKSMKEEREIQKRPPTEVERDRSAAAAQAADSEPTSPPPATTLAQADARRAPDAAGPPSLDKRAETVRPADSE